METWVYISGGTALLVVVILILARVLGKKKAQASGGAQAGAPGGAGAGQPVGHTQYIQSSQVAAQLAQAAMSANQTAPPSNRPARPEDKTMQQSVVKMCGGCGQPMSPEWAFCMSCGWAPPAGGAQLEIASGPLAGRFVGLDAEVTTIGSMEGNALVINDPGVPRKAIGIRRNGTGYELADLGSPGGILVNGQRMAKRNLVAGDVVRIGKSELVFRAAK